MLADRVIDGDRRRQALNAKSQAMDSLLLANSAVDPEEKRQKLFAKKLASDSCTISLTDYISFNADGLVNLTIYEVITEKQLDLKIGTCDYRVYEKQAFISWIKDHKCDMTDRDRGCLEPEVVNGKFNKTWLKMFVNIKRIKDTGLLANISEKWFVYKKLYCLMNLHPEIFQPQFLYYIELMDFAKISIHDIRYINNHYARYGNLPAEIIFLGRCITQDDRCNLEVDNLNSSMLAIFDKYNSKTIAPVRYSSISVVAAVDSLVGIDETAPKEEKMTSVVRCISR